MQVTGDGPLSRVLVLRHGRRNVLAGLGLAMLASGCREQRVTGRAKDTYDIVTVPGEVATTPNLRQLALTSWDNDFSAIGVCDLQAGTAEVLQAERKATLRTPALSPDGGTLAFTAFPLGDDFAGLFIATVGGGPARRIGRRLTYAGPSFSADGRRILVFAGDVAYGPDQLVEIDLATGVEDVVWPGAFAGGSGTAYDLRLAGYLVAARGPAKSLEEANDWRSLDYDIQHGTPRNFRVPRDGGEPLPVAPAELVGTGAEFRGVTAAGDVLLHSFSPEQGYKVFLVGPQGAVRTIWRQEDRGAVPSGVAISADGLRLLTSRRLSDAAGDSTGRYEIAVREVGRPGDSRRLSSDLRATVRPLLLP